MISISEMFSMIGVNGCSDVATSLAMQGCVPNIDIPIYEILNLHIESGANAGHAASSVQEYNMLRRLAINCGTVTASINIAGIQLLTLANALLIFTPSYGMAVFLKLAQLDVGNIGIDMIDVILEAAGIPIPDYMEEATGMVSGALTEIFNKMIENIQGDLANFGITLYPWEELEDYYNDLKRSGEMDMMRQNRQMIGAATL